uniref:Uncharacterized protein n=1 Tax=Mycena chlorophos TaxID=658473 RepID=A0ABQ0L4Q6_MYCCL|nr:predicted protein [Mycena chlorophos]
MGTSEGKASWDCSRADAAPVGVCIGRPPGPDPRALDVYLSLSATAHTNFGIWEARPASAYPNAAHREDYKMPVHAVLRLLHWKRHRFTLTLNCPPARRGGPRDAGTVKLLSDRRGRVWAMIRHTHSKYGFHLATESRKRRVHVAQLTRQRYPNGEGAVCGYALLDSRVVVMFLFSESSNRTGGGAKYSIFSRGLKAAAALSKDCQPSLLSPSSLSESLSTQCTPPLLQPLPPLWSLPAAMKHAAQPPPSPRCRTDPSALTVDGAAESTHPNASSVTDHEVLHGANMAPSIFPWQDPIHVCFDHAFLSALELFSVPVPPVPLVACIHALRTGMQFESAKGPSPAGPKRIFLSIRTSDVCDTPRPSSRCTQHTRSRTSRTP